MENPEKTVLKRDLKEDLHGTNQFEGNNEKVIYVGGINCSRQNAYNEMRAVWKHFGNRGKNKAYHGVQSFASGEVTPEEAFKIGKETARRMWGDRFQVLVAVHMNTDNIHCHFVSNAFSFINGRKFENKTGDHLELRKISDDVCMKYGKSVIMNSEFYSNGKNKEYWLLKRGIKTKRVMIHEDVEYCIRYSYSIESFAMQLRGMGYELDPVRFTIRSKGWEYPLRLSKLGFPKENIYKKLDENMDTPDCIYECNCHPPYKPKKFPLEKEVAELEFGIEQSYDTGTVMVDTLLFILITLAKIEADMADVKLISPDCRYELNDLKQLQSDYHLLSSENVHTVKELETTIEKTKERITDLEKQRNRLKNKQRRAATPKEKAILRKQRTEITNILTALRKKLKQQQKILEKLPRLFKCLQQEYSLEREAKQKTERSR